MVLIAVHKETNSIIEADDVDFVESKRRNFTYFCIDCNNELFYRNKHTRKGKPVICCFCHKNENNDCDSKMEREANYYEISNFINKWINNVKPEYKYYKPIGDIIDINNDKDDFIYVKYSLVTQKNIRNKINSNGKIIWLLSIGNELSENHPRSCKIYEVNDNKNVIHFLTISKKSDLVDFDLTKCDVYLDNSYNIYQLIDNTNYQKFYAKNREKITGIQVKQYSPNYFIENICGNIFNNEFAYEQDNENNIINIAYTKKGLKKLYLINSIQKKLNFLDDNRYKKINLETMNYNDLIELNNNVDISLKKQELLDIIILKIYHNGLNIDTDMCYDAIGLLEPELNR